jgi:hypothetical protein
MSSYEAGPQMLWFSSSAALRGSSCTKDSLLGGGGVDLCNEGENKEGCEKK